MFSQKTQVWFPVPTWGSSPNSSSRSSMPLTSMGSCVHVHVNSCRSTACTCILKLNYIFKEFECLGYCRDPNGGFRTNKATTLKLRSVTCHLPRMSFWCACLLSAFSVMWTENNPASLGASENPTRPWHPWAGNVQRRVVTLPLCKVRKLKPWLVRHPTVVHQQILQAVVPTRIQSMLLELSLCLGHWESFILLLSW